MQTDALVERLGCDLRPVRPRSLRRDLLVLLWLALAEIGAVIGLGFMRSDISVALDRPSFWWKLVSMGAIALVSGVVALLSIDPARSPRGGARWIIGCIAGAFASGWLIDASQAGFIDAAVRLEWTHGLDCIARMVILSIPPGAAFTLLLRRGAPTDLAHTAVAAGLSCAAWGASPTISLAHQTIRSTWRSGTRSAAPWSPPSRGRYSSACVVGSDDVAV